MPSGGNGSTAWMLNKILAFYTSAQGIAVKMSMTPQPDAGHGSLSSGSIEISEVLGYFPYNCFIQT